MLTDDRPIIAWVFDTKDWAFDKTATELIARLPSFRHTKIFMDGVNVNAKRVSDVSDIVVVFCPHYLPLFWRANNVLARIDSYRSLESCGLV